MISSVGIECGIYDYAAHSITEERRRTGAVMQEQHSDRLLIVLAGSVTNIVKGGEWRGASVEEL